MNQEIFNLPKKVNSRAVIQSFLFRKEAPGVVFRLCSNSQVYVYTRTFLQLKKIKTKLLSVGFQRISA